MQLDVRIECITIDIENKKIVVKFHKEVEIDATVIKSIYSYVKHQWVVQNLSKYPFPFECYHTSVNSLDTPTRTGGFICTLGGDELFTLQSINDYMSISNGFIPNDDLIDVIRNF